MHFMKNNKISLKGLIEKSLNIIGEKIKYQFTKLGYQISRNTEKEKVVNLIKSLRPYKIEKELIRLGGVKDGGYLVPNDLEGIKTCFSPGVDAESSFEIDCINRGMQVYLADNSIEKPNIDSTRYQYKFIKKHIGTTSNDDFITLAKWVSESKINLEEDLLLQMDIEGAEYHTLLTTDDKLLKRFRIILIEFHYLEKLWDKDFFSIADAVFKKLLSTHTCVHIHPNNCSGIHKYKGVKIPNVLEFSFIRNDRITSKEFQNQFPHKLDSDNLKNKASIILPKNWYIDSVMNT